MDVNVPLGDQREQLADQLGAIALDDNDNHVILAMERAVKGFDSNDDNESGEDEEEVFDDCDPCYTCAKDGGCSQEDEDEDSDEDNDEDEDEDDDDDEATSSTSSTLSLPRKKVEMPKEIHPDNVKFLRWYSVCKNFMERCEFQIIVVKSLYTFIVYLHKLYEDGAAIDEYKDERYYRYFAVSLIALIIPTLLNMVYRVCYVILEVKELERSTGEKPSEFEIQAKAFNHSPEEEPSTFAQKIATEAVNGLLLIALQVRSHLTLLHFAVQRLFEWRKVTEDEDVMMKRMAINAALLEFFEDFYAGFLQVFLQVYIGWETLGWTGRVEEKGFMKFELMGSILSIIALLVAVKRQDDGIWAGFLSFTGWILMITSRVLVMTLATTVIGPLILPICVLHIACFTAWIYDIALDSHLLPNPWEDADKFRPDSKWDSLRNRIVLLVMVVCLFGIPSLLIWPMLFQLNAKGRPLTFLIITTIENACLLIVCIVGSLNLSTLTPIWTITPIVVIFNGLGFLCLWTYIGYKPPSCDRIILIDIREQEDQLGRSIALEYGIYYNFFDLVFRLASTDEYKKIIDKAESEGRVVTTIWDHYQRYKEEKKAAKIEEAERARKRAERKAEKAARKAELERIQAKIQAELADD